MEKTEAEIYENVSFIDEYPQIVEKLRLRRLAKSAIRTAVNAEIFVLPTPINSSDYLGQS